MLIIKRLEWHNCFSYSKDNYIDFDAAPLTQVLGLNGTGKSSIPLILEEAIYGKNSKNIKKQDIANRFIDGATIGITVTFSANGKEYRVVLTRKSTIKISLFEDGEDISSHTSKNTYKKLEEIIGMDFKTFSQLIYQSSKSGLDFLTATDTARKTFLISLFSLSEYTKYYELFKEEHREVSKIVAGLNGSISSVTKMIKANEGMVEIPELMEVPEHIGDLGLPALELELANIDKTNRNIGENNQYKKILKNIDMSLLVPVPAPTGGDALTKKEATIKQQISTIKAKLDKINKVHGHCHTCLQPIDEDLQTKMIEEAKMELAKLGVGHANVIKEVEEHKNKRNKWNKHKNATEEFERLSNLIDNDLPTEIIDESELKRKIIDAKDKIERNRRATREAQAHNAEVDKKKGEAEYKAQHLKQYTEELETLKTKLETQERVLSDIDILRKAFSTSGLVSYKIEYLVKDLEFEINKYLGELSAGRFQVNFALRGEKLNVDIVDNGDVISIAALSSGELARVNIATLLSIRKLMSTLSKTRINLLFLDEVMGVLDSDGREKLIEILLAEENLNTFLVSHEYTHPLLEKVQVVKEDNISRVEHG